MTFDYLLGECPYLLIDYVQFPFAYWCHTYYGVPDDVVVLMERL